MAMRRMFSKNITEKASFLRMPLTTQALYFHLGIHADDDGIVEAFKVLRMINGNEDDLRVLASKQLVRVLNEDLVTFITDWGEHNLIRADRKKNSIYANLLLQIVPEAEIKEPRPRADRPPKHTGTSPGQPMDGLGKGRVGEDRVGKDTCDADAPQEVVSPINSLIKEFEPINPSFARLYPNKTQRAALERLLKQHGEDQLRVIIQFLQKTNGRKYAPTITTPTQLEEKLASLIAFCEKQKDVAMPKPAKEIIGL